MKLFDQDGKLDSDIQDALSELGNVGVGMASITIGKILGVRVELAAPRVIPLEEVSQRELLKQIGQENIGIWMRFAEPMHGAVLCILKQGFVYDVVEKMAGRRYEKEGLYEDEMAFSAVIEFANMLSAAYMKAVGKYTGMQIFVSPRMFMTGRDLVSIGEALDQEEMSANKAIWVETSFQLLEKEGDKTRDVGRVVMLPDDDTVAMLMEALGL